MIYYIACAETYRLKIGYKARDPYKRLAALQTGSATRLVLVGLGVGTKDTEKQLHARFAKSREHGEWFDLSTGLYDHMRSVVRETCVETEPSRLNRLLPDALLEELQA